MSDVDQRAINTFGKWLSTLADDARKVAEMVANETVSERVRRPLAGAINYLFKSLDLIDDGIEGLGFLDDAFVLRIAASNAKNAGEVSDEVAALSADATLVREALGDLALRLDKFVASLETGKVRGRTVDAIVSDQAVREEVLGDVSGWASRYNAPAFVMDEQALVKVRSFLAAKLP